MVRRTPCPRCGGQLIGWGDEDTSCLHCGYLVHPRSPWAADLLGPGIDGDSEAEPNPPEPRKRRKAE